MPAERTFLFSSESVNEGHPDKLCDQVSDAVLDACLAADPLSKVACETACKDNMVMVLGEITTKAKLDSEIVDLKKEIDTLRVRLDPKKAEREAAAQYSSVEEAEIIDEEEYSFIQKMKEAKGTYKLSHEAKFPPKKPKKVAKPKAPPAKKEKPAEEKAPTNALGGLLLGDHLLLGLDHLAHLLVDDDLHLLGLLLGHHELGLQLDNLLQIGRASCRERV